MGLLQGYKQFTELLGRFKTEPQRIACRAQTLMRNYRIDQLLSQPEGHFGQEAPEAKQSSSGAACQQDQLKHQNVSLSLLLVVDVQLLSHVRLFVTPWAAA